MASNAPLAVSTAAAKSPLSVPVTTSRPSVRTWTPAAVESPPAPLKSKNSRPSVSNVVSRVPSVFSRKTTTWVDSASTVVDLRVAATTILPSGWTATSAAFPSEPRSSGIRFRPNPPTTAVPSASRVVSGVPSAFSRVTENWTSDRSGMAAVGSPTITTLPSAVVVTADAWPGVDAEQLAQVQEAVPGEGRVQGSGDRGDPVFEVGEPESGRAGVIVHADIN